MSRFVKAVPYNLVAKAAAQQDGSTVGKEYIERVVKYVPAEIITAYTFLNAILGTVTKDSQIWAYGAAFILCGVATPFYFKLIVTEPDQSSLRTQQWLSGLAFLVWAYGTDGGKGFFGQLGHHIYQQGFGVLGLVAFSLFIGIFYPVKK